MYRASRPRGEDLLTAPQESDATPTSLESLVALCLCMVVILACMAFLRRTSDYSRALTELQREERRERPRKREAQARPRPDLVILLTLDGLRADRLSFHGYERETTPRLRALGEEGLVLRTVAAQSSHPLISHRSLLTGKYPATLMLEATGADLVDLASVREARAYLQDTFTQVRGALAAGFREGGFRTAGFTDGASLGSGTGVAHGFEVFDGSGGGLEALLARALAWLERSGASPGFVLVQAGEGRVEDGAAGQALTPADRAALSAHYDEALLAADASLGGFLDELRARGLYERALIVVTSAHGESLGERGVVGHGGLYLEQLLVPLILKLPRAIGLPPARIDEPVELVDLLPTLFELCGLSLPDDLDGRSLLPTLFRGVHGRDYLVAETAFGEAPWRRSSPAVRTLLRPGRWQVIQDVARAQATLYALEHDPHGLAGLPVAAEEVADLVEVLLARGRSGPRAVLRPTAPARFSPELERQLEELGYDAAALGGRDEASVR
jgi:arylsulfatase